MTITYPTQNKRIVDLGGGNCRVDDLLNNANDKTDGFIWRPASDIMMVTSSTAAVYTKNAQGDYSWNRIAGGAETHYAVCPAVLPGRTGSNKGFKLRTFTIAYALGVVDATSVDVLIDQITYAHGVAVAVATHGGAVADATYDANHDTAAERKASAGGSNPHLLTITLTTPVFQSNAARYVNAEVAFILANTGTLKVYGYGWGYTFDNL